MAPVCSSRWASALSLRAFLEAEKYTRGRRAVHHAAGFEFLVGQRAPRRLHQHDAAVHRLQHPPWRWWRWRRPGTPVRSPGRFQVPAGAPGRRGEGYKPDHPFYGGIGYGGGEHPTCPTSTWCWRPEGHVHRPEGPGVAEGAGVRQPVAEPQRGNDQKWARQRRRLCLIPAPTPPSTRTAPVLRRRHDGGRPAEPALRRRRQRRTRACRPPTSG